MKASVARRVQFVDGTEEYELCSECSSGDQSFSGKLTKENCPDLELSGESGAIIPLLQKIVQ